MPTLLAIIPHPDDEAYSFGGTLALASRAGWRCVVHCASSGERGGRHDGVRAKPRTLGPAREEELRASCRILGTEPPEFWRLPNEGLRRLQAQEKLVGGLLRELAPDVVLALGCDGAYGHLDHLAVYRWVVAAWAASDEPRPVLLFAAFPLGLFLPQYDLCLPGGILGAKREGLRRFFRPGPPPITREAIGTADRHYKVDVSPVREVKLAAIAAHRTQLPGGEPRALFPEGIIDALLDVERFVDARGHRDEETARLLASLG